MEKGGREVNKWLKTLDIRTEYLLYHAIMLFEDNTFHNTWKKKVVKNDDIYCWQFLIYECVKWNRYKKAQTSGSFQLGFKSSRLLYQTTSYIEKVFSNQSSSSGWHSSIWSHIEFRSPKSWPSSGQGSEILKLQRQHLIFAHHPVIPHHFILCWQPSPRWRWRGWRWRGWRWRRWKGIKLLTGEYMLLL